MDFSPVAQYMQKLTERGVPGCDIIITRGHERLCRYSCGYADREGKRPVAPTDLYRLYSCTKPVTVTAAMQLVERGLLDPDAPVADYLPAYAHVRVLKDGGAVPAERVMRVRHLFTMSAGMDYDVDAAPIRRVLEETGNRATTRQIVDAMAEKPLLFEPGERFQYSLCHDVLGGVIEAASGKTLGAYLRENIFDPLGMRDSVLHVTEETAGRLSDRWHYIPETGEIRLEPRGDGFTIGEVYESGGGSLVCTLDDYARFADAMACGGMGATGERILSPATIDLMRTEQLTSLLDDPSFGCAAGPGYGYGMGVRTLTDLSVTARAPRGEFGWDGAGGVDILIDPDNGISMVFAMHVLRWNLMLGYVHHDLRELVYAAVMG